MAKKPIDEENKLSTKEFLIWLGLFALISIIVFLISIPFGWDLTQIESVLLLLGASIGVSYAILNAFFVKGFLSTLIKRKAANPPRLTSEEKNNIYTYLTAGLEYDDQDRIKDFLKYYLDAPFAGRTDLLKILNDWLQNNDKPIYVLTEKAGRGKSALVSQWIAQVRESHPDTDIAFLPIAQRFDSNRPSVFLRMLAERLAYLHGGRLQPGDHDPEIISYWKGECTNLVKKCLPKNNQLLIVLDGLDESSDANVKETWRGILPKLTEDCRAHTHILLSMRRYAEDESGHKWSERLGLPEEKTHIGNDFPQLTKAEIVQMLRALGFPLDKIPAREAILKELLRLCENDPLLVRYYAEELRMLGREVNLTDLKNLESGYPGLFKLWKDQETETKSNPRITQAMEWFFKVLSSAKGPLNREDLASLMGEKCPFFTSGEKIDQLKSLTTRFILGDGKEKGFIFQHPRFADYYREEVLLDNERKEVNQYFINYGESVLRNLSSKMMKPEESPEYPIRYYCQHLQDAKAPPETFYALLCEGWQKAHVYHDKTEISFLNDVQIINEIALLEKNLEMNVFASLCFSSVASLSNNIDPDLLAQCLHVNILNLRQVKALIERKKNNKEKSKAYLKIAQVAKNKKNDLLKNSLSIANNIAGTKNRAKALHAIAPEISNFQLQQEYLKIARKINDHWSRSIALSTIAPQISNSQLKQEILSEAFSLACKIESTGACSAALSAIAPQISNPQLQKNYLAFSRNIKTHSARSTALSAIAPQISNPQLRHEILSEALSAAQSIVYNRFRSTTLSAIAPHLSDHQLQKEYLSTAYKILSAGIRSTALYAIAPQITNPQLRQEILSKALFAAFEISNPKFQCEALNAIAPLLSNTQLQKTYLTTIRNTASASVRPIALSSIAPQISNSQLKNEILSEALSEVLSNNDDRYRSLTLCKIASQIYNPQLQKEYLSIARNIENSKYRSEALCAIVPNIPNTEVQREILSEALYIARSIKTEKFLASTLCKIAPELSKPQLQRDYLNVASNIENVSYRCATLRAIALQASDPQLQKETLSKALSTAHNIPNARFRCMALCEIAPQISDPQTQQELLSEALSSARSIELAKYRCAALRTIALQISDPQPQQEILSEAISTAHNIPSAGFRCEALCEIALHISDIQLKKETLSEVLSTARSIELARYRCTALCTIALQISDSQTQQELLSEALSTACDIESVRYRCTALCEIALQHPNPQLQKKILSEALFTAQSIENPKFHCIALGLIALQHPNSNLQKEILSEALSIARTIEYDGARSVALSTLAPQLSTPQFKRTYLSLTSCIKDQWARYTALSAIATQLTNDEFSSEIIQQGIFKSLLATKDNVNPIYETIAKRWGGIDLSIDLLITIFTNNQNVERKHLFELIGAMTPAIASYDNGQEMLGEIMQAMDEVSRWWP